MKTFLVINTSYFGDTILTDGLCRNLKRIYPDSRIVFMANKPFADVARYMDGVDKLWVFDKWNKHKGLAGCYAFYKEHKGEESFDASFVIYGNERGILLSKMLGAKKIYSDSRAIMGPLLDNQKIDYGELVHAQDKHAYLATLYSGQKFEDMKIKYNVPVEAKKFVKRELLKDCKQRIVALNPVTKRKEKDLKVDMLVELVDKLYAENFKILIIGAGNDVLAYYEALPETTKNKLQSCINKTTIPQLGALLQESDVLVSADTGTVHLALALDVPVVDVFYINDAEVVREWGPKAMYKHRLVADGDFSSERIYKEIISLLGE